MKSLQFYTYSTWLLLLLNVAMLTFFFLTKPKHPPKGGHFLESAIEVMKLDAEQGAKFEGLAKAHDAQMQATNDQQKALLAPYFQSILEPSTNIDSLGILDAVQSLERQKIELTHQHFQAIKTILQPAQYADFELFMQKALDKILYKKGT